VSFKKHWKKNLKTSETEKKLGIQGFIKVKNLPSREKRLFHPTIKPNKSQNVSE
jgi:hypothetical protein